MILGVDDGLFHGYNDFADICFLIAVIIFVIAAAFQYRTPNAVYGSGLVTVGLIAVALGFLVL